MNSLIAALSILSAAPVAPAAKAEAKPVAASPVKMEAKGEVESGECHHGPTAEEAPKATGTTLTRGEKLKGLAAVKLETLLASPGEYDGKTIALEGSVRKACSRKGCWMELASDEKGPGVRVTFKDYGFFVPLDSAGSKAKLEGTVKVAELAPDRAEHYASEGAHVEKAKDGKYHEVQVIASGLELTK